MNYFKPKTELFFNQIKTHGLSNGKIIEFVKEETNNSLVELQNLYVDFEVFLYLTDGDYSPKKVEAAKNLINLKYREAALDPYSKFRGISCTEFPNGNKACAIFMILLQKLIDEKTRENKEVRVQKVKQKQISSPSKPKALEEIFFNRADAEICLNILRELEKPAIDEKNNYIGKNKGVFPLWIKILKSHKPNSLIKNFPDEVYKDLLNAKIIGLNLSKDASEFRKDYAMLQKDKVDLEIKTILSQSSQSGKLGK